MTQPPFFETVCSVSENEYVWAHFIHLRPRPWLRVAGVVLLLLVSLALGATALQLPDRGFMYPPFWTLIAALAYFVVWFTLWRPFILRRLYRQHAQPGASFILRVDTDSIEMENSLGHVRIPWSHLRKWKEGRKAFLLYHTDALFQIIPKGCLSDENLQVFRSQLEDNARRAT